MSDEKRLPLEGLRVVEFTHMVMGPTCGLILADLGAEVIKVEPVTGDNTRHLKGSGAGFFPMFNRNKKSIAIDLHTPEGIQIAMDLIATADVVSENFKAGTMKRLGLDYETLSKINEKLIYVSHRGFLPGPYAHRTALDEVVQMLGGLAYMTGRPGDPLRAGASVNDIMGGMFGAIGVMAAIMQRSQTGRGIEVQSALYENNVFLVATHMMQFALTGKPAAPMPSRISAWGIYDVFSVKDGEQIFLAVVSDTQWKIFCDAFEWMDLRDDEKLLTNNQRVAARDWLMPELRARLGDRSAGEIAAMFDAHGLPYAPIRAPHELYDDEHLNETGGLSVMTLADGQTVKAPLLPITLDQQRLTVRTSPPSLGEDTDEILRAINISDQDIERLRQSGVVV